MEEDEDIKNRVEKEKNYEELSIDGLLNEINSLKKKLKHLEDLLKSKKSGYTQATKLFKK